MRSRSLAVARLQGQPVMYETLFQIREWIRDKYTDAWVWGAFTVAVTGSSLAAAPNLCSSQAGGAVRTLIYHPRLPRLQVVAARMSKRQPAPHPAFSALEPAPL